MSNAQSDYIARGWQRWKDSDGFFCACKVVHLKEQAYLHPDGNLVGITPPPLKTDEFD